MFKVLLWDYLDVSNVWVEQVVDKKYTDIVGKITPAEPVPKILLEQDKWDWLLIFEQGMRNFFETTIELLNLPHEKIIYASDVNSWMQNPEAIFTITKPDNYIGENIRHWYDYLNNRRSNYFVTCTLEGLSYVATSADNAIMRNMYIKRVNWAKGSMKIFHELAKKYYNVDDSAGYFLDLGANIGTTSIYFLKKFTPNLRALAFEPDTETFKLLHVNLILNDLESNIDIVNCGLGNKFDEMTLYRRLDDPGYNSVFQYQDDMIPQTIKIIPLDSYLDENKLAVQEVKYIWIDTEGFEPQVLLGAKNLLRENSAPIFAECNVGAWKKSGAFEEMMKLLAKYYSHFVLIENEKQVLYPLETLSTLTPSNSPLGNRGDIFLIKRGAIG